MLFKSKALCVKIAPAQTFKGFVESKFLIIMTSTSSIKLKVVLYLGFKK